MKILIRLNRHAMQILKNYIIVEILAYPNKNSLSKNSITKSTYQITKTLGTQLSIRF